MHDAEDNVDEKAGGTLPGDLASCHALIEQDRACNEKLSTEHSQLSTEYEELSAETDKLRKLLSRLVNGNKSERRVLDNPGQQLLPFESEEEYEAAKVEAKQVIDKYTVKQHERKKKRRSEQLPADLPRVEVAVAVDDSLKTCPTHGERRQIGEDIRETLVVEPPKAYVEVRRFPKFACPADKKCGVASPERPTGLVEGNRYSPSVAAAVVDYKWGHYLPLYRQQDLFAASGCTPRRSTLCNLVEATEFAVDPLLDLMKSRVQQDLAVGLDDTSCRMLLPKVDPPADPADPADPKSVRLAEKLRETRSKGHKSLHAKMWVYSGLCTGPYHVFDFRVSRHRDGPDEFFRESHCYVQGDYFSGNTSVVMQSDGRLEFIACWAHARRKVAGGERSAKMMSLVSSARRHDLDSRQYIQDTLAQLLAGSTDYVSMLPDVWKQSHPEAIRAYRQEERRDKADRKQLHAARRRLLKSAIT